MAAAASKSETRTVRAGLLSLEVRDDPGICLIHIAGELDLGSAAALDHELRRAVATDAAAIVLDLERLEFIDSTGVQCLTKAARSANGAGRLRVVGCQGEPRRIFRLTGLDAILPLVA